MMVMWCGVTCGVMMMWCGVTCGMGWCVWWCCRVGFLWCGVVVLWSGVVVLVG